MYAVNCHRCHNFLLPAEHAALRHAVALKQNLFAPARVIGEANARSGSMIFGPVIEPEIATIMPRLQWQLSAVFRQLAIEPFAPEFDLQITMYGQGGYFSRHVDVNRGTEEPSAVTRRQISFVYYFRLHDAAEFFGGQLRIYTDDSSEYYDDIEPVDNSAVFFPSDRLHEVMPVLVPSRQFIDNRFTVNGWLLSPEI